MVIFITAVGSSVGVGACTVVAEGSCIDEVGDGIGLPSLTSIFHPRFL